MVTTALEATTIYASTFLLVGLGLDRLVTGPPRQQRSVMKVGDSEAAGKTGHKWAAPTRPAVAGSATLLADGAPGRQPPPTQSGRLGHPHPRCNLLLDPLQPPPLQCESCRESYHSQGR